ncbi:unnamed protein product [Penicillium salamii]|nr:unnamed protein product [Penicillium salamii]
MASTSSPDYKALFQQERERRKEKEQRRKHLEDRQKQMTLVESLRHCHNALSRPLRAKTLSRSTTGQIPIPKGKHCPTRLERWMDCEAQQQDIYNSVRRHLQPEEDAPRLFPSQIVLDGLSEHFRGPIRSEYDLQTYERLAVEDHTRNTFSELCKIPAARDEFGIGDGVLFYSYPNVLNETEIVEMDTKDTAPRGKPDQFFIHRVDGGASTLLTSVEYKPPHKLPLDDIHRGLRDIDLWEEMVRSNKVPKDKAELLVYNSQQLVCSAIVQKYHVMIQEELEYSYITTGLALILLWVPYDKPSTLHYHFCEPNQEVNNVDGELPHPNTSVARVLCLCLMSFRSRPRNQQWRNEYCSNLSPSQRFPHQNEQDNQNDMSQRQKALFCTQHCLLGLKNGTALDDSCPNFNLHRQSGDGAHHPINAVDLVSLLKQQMDEYIDRCIPFGSCGSYGAPFKLTCSPYGYTVVGKGTTSGLWKVVSREAEIYHILQKAQGSAVPVFLGKMDLAKIYFLHGAGQIRHMLVMGWAGESTAKLEQTPKLRREIKRSKEKIRTLGVRHLDLRPENILWNAELGRALIIDFHRSELDRRPATDRPMSRKRYQRRTQMPEAKRARVL